MPPKTLLPTGKQYDFPEEQEETYENDVFEFSGYRMSYTLQPARLVHAEADEERTFRDLAERWYEDTLYTSSISKMTMHPAYLRIIGMGARAVPLLLRELERTGDHWLVALHAITGEDPAPVDASFGEAVEAWLTWGKENGYL